jgi:hypothetical protein
MQSATLLPRCRTPVLVIAIIISTALTVSPAKAYVTFGQGFSSKWGDEPQFGSGAVVTWGYMLDNTAAHPSLPAYNELMGTSQIGSMRTSIDTAYGVGAFDAAIQKAFNTWSAVAHINFVGPIADSGLPAGQQGTTSPNIRIGAFHAVPNSGFSFVGAIGYGPTGIVTPGEDFSGAGDIFFNLDAGFQIMNGIEDVTPIDYNLGNELEGLILHELGHSAIGLGHPPWNGEDPDKRVMYVGDFFSHPEWPECCLTVNHKPHPDDVAGAQYVYGIRGDYNDDGIVDAADYVTWRNSIGQSTTKGTGADGIIDGMIDAADYDVWRANFGTVGASSNGTAANEPQTMYVGPEPSVPILLAAAIVLLGTRRTRID